MSNVIDTLRNDGLRDDLPEFAIGDTVRVAVRIKEGGKERLQNFEGAVIAMQGTGLEKTLTVRKLIGLRKYSNITLKWGITDDAELWDWRKKVMDGKIERKSGAIVLLNDEREEKLRWNFKEAWPTKWSAPALNATGNEVAIETLELAHESVEKA